MYIVLEGKTMLKLPLEKKLKLSSLSKNITVEFYFMLNVTALDSVQVYG